MHGSLNASVADALRRHGHQVQTIEQARIAADNAAGLLEQAHQLQLDLITDDPLLANAPFEQKIRFGRSIVLLQLEGGEVEQDDAIDRIFERYKRLSPGRLYTVTGTRVKVRQLPP